jgi:endonuclease/exonuclease/phosphatase family metal-dependent hydrolase
MVATDDIRVVQANLYMRLSAEDFKQDLKTIEGFEPDITCLNEVDGRNPLLRVWANGNKLKLVQHYESAGSDGDAALFFAQRFEIITFGTTALHGEPPNKPSKRYAAWAIVKDKLTGVVFRVIGVHTLPSVENNNKLKSIPRVKFFVTGVKNILVLDKKLRKTAKKLTGQYGVGLLLGDMNWGDRVGSWLRSVLGVWYVNSFQTLGFPNRGTLGSRAIDYAWKRGKIAQWIYQYVFPLKSDHNGLFAVLRITK